MSQQKKKIALIIDNCTAHNFHGTLSNVKLVCLPPNCTSILQPLDMGIIKCFKAYYRRRLVEKILFHSERGNFIPNAINVKEACDEISSSWFEVTAKTIHNCWKKADFMQNVEIDDSEESVAVENLQNVLGRLHPPPCVTAAQYVCVDDGLDVVPVLTDEAIIEEIRGTGHEENDAGNEEDNDENYTENELISNTGAIQAIEDLKNYFSSLPNIDERHFYALDNLQKRERERAGRLVSGLIDTTYQKLRQRN